jgi:subtilisin family serine protease
MRIEQVRESLSALKQEAQSQATNRYDAVLYDIENIKGELEKVRSRLLPLLDLEKDAKRRQNRIDREHVPEEIAVERINGTADFQDVFIIDRLASLKNAVCRISLNGQGIGTGFQVAEGIIITNHHVIPDSNVASQLVAEFGYELDSTKQIRSAQTCKLRPDLLFCTSSIRPLPGDPTSGLDFSFVAIDTTAIPRFGERFSVAPLDGTLGKIVVGEQCITIQHPAGEPKKIVFKDISLLKFTDTHLIYESDTLPGSSGSMVVGLGTGEIIALHHAGVPKRDNEGNPLTKTGAVAFPGTPDEQIDWEGNEGVRVSCIIAALEKMQLPANMTDYRNQVLKRTNEQRNRSGQQASANAGLPAPVETNASKMTTPTPTILAPAAATPVQASAINMILLASYNSASVKAINAFLSQRYGSPVAIKLVTPLTARKGSDELFTFAASFGRNTSDEVAALLRFPYIKAAEADLPMALNTSFDNKTAAKGLDGTPVFESAVKEAIWEDEFSTWNEEDFWKRWKEHSAYVKGKSPDDFRRWNHFATGFDRLTEQDYDTLDRANIVIAQLDTGFTTHSKVVAGFDTDEDYDAIDNDNTARDELDRGILKFPAHGTRTGSLLIGRKPLLSGTHDGNFGMITPGNTKLIPYRIAKTVLLLNRQQELAKALDRAISGGVQVLTMSMGTAPTITTARLAKKAYDAGVIWCCAAGNEVKFVVAPAVFPGTIAVAASNPSDEPWSKSSEGKTVDITAPGEDVYVPIFTKDSNGNTGEDYAYGDGTSYATPHIAAAAALWLAKYKQELKDFAGWQRVEAFRQALRATARTKHNLPGGYGAGILDVYALLNDLQAKPGAGIKPNKLTYAYSNWNESAFLASLQGWTELFKTYWNVFHRGLGRLFGGESTLAEATGGDSLSSFAREQEALLFGRGDSLESTAVASPQDAMKRMQALNNLILQNANQ